MAKLTSTKVVIATSGKTIDGRELNADPLKKLVDEYDKDYYPAIISHNHRWCSFFNPNGTSNFGVVEGLTFGDHPDQDKTGKLKNKKAVFARLSITKEGLNKIEKENLYWSIEYLPRILATKQPYMLGLSMVDAPASVGIRPIKFSVGGLEQTEEFKVIEGEKIQYKSLQNNDSNPKIEFRSASNIAA